MYQYLLLIKLQALHFFVSHNPYYGYYLLLIMKVNVLNFSLKFINLKDIKIIKYCYIGVL